MSYLYHCAKTKPEDGVLRPHAEIEQGGQKRKLLFGNDLLSLALSHAFSKKNHEVLARGRIARSYDSWILLCGGSDTLTRPRKAHVYALQRQNFEPVQQNALLTEWASANIYTIECVKNVMESSDLNEYMSHGLQIFVINDRYETIQRNQSVMQAIRDVDGSSDPAGLIHDLSRLTRVQWLNWDEANNFNSTLKTNLTVLQTRQAREDQKNRDAHSIRGGGGRMHFAMRGHG